jgi:hypothetical protein
MAQREQAVATMRVTDQHARVTEYRFADGAETGWHRHEHEYVVVPMMDGKRSVGALLSLKARMCSQIRRNGFELTLWMTLMLTRRMAFGGLRF